MYTLYFFTLMPDYTDKLKIDVLMMITKYVCKSQEHIDGAAIRDFIHMHKAEIYSA